MTSPLYERGGLDFRPQDGKTSERQFAIIAFVIGRAAPDHKQPPGLENPINAAIISLPDPITLLAGNIFTITLKRQDGGAPAAGFCWFLISHFSG
jgi:hypothetical protein